MPRTLVLFYSRTGHTRSVADVIRSNLYADIEELRDVQPRKGLFRGWLRSIREVRKKLDAEVLPVRKDLAAYDLIVLGTPVWAGCLCSPMRTFLERNGAAIRNIAVFVTERANGGGDAIDQIAALLGKHPRASLIVRDSELKSGAYRKAAMDFAKRLQSHRLSATREYHSSASSAGTVQQKGRSDEF